jgi:hypothetical protein
MNQWLDPTHLNRLALKDPKYDSKTLKKGVGEPWHMRRRHTPNDLNYQDGNMVNYAWR